MPRRWRRSARCAAARAGRRWPEAGGRGRRASVTSEDRGHTAIVRVSILASSSSGNATFVATSHTRLLVDAGLSVRELTRRLALIGERPEDLDAVLITHEHSDHVSGLARLVKRHGKKAYLSRLTAPAIDWNGASPNVELFQAGSRFAIGDIEVNSFTVPHDAIDPVGFTLHAEGVRIGLATDLGYVTESVRVHLESMDFVLLESNHDLEMLKVGPYPWSVKQRVMSRVGHLSNPGACDFILRDLGPNVAHLVLGHLSEHNNHPEIVRLGAQQALAERGARAALSVAGPKHPTEVFSF